MTCGSTGAADTFAQIALSEPFRVRMAMSSDCRWWTRRTRTPRNATRLVGHQFLIGLRLWRWRRGPLVIDHYLRRICSTLPQGLIIDASLLFLANDHDSKNHPIAFSITRPRFKPMRTLINSHAALARASNVRNNPLFPRAHVRRHMGHLEPPIAALGRATCTR